jgi:putative ABC transport system permease protein
MGFVMTLLISGVGFIIFWILSVKKRGLQFGILRSMGLSKTNITKILLWDQIFVSGTAVLLGLIVGFVSSELYIPVLQVSAAAADQIPSMIITSLTSDYIRIVVSVLIIIVIGVIILSGILRRMNIGQTLKLGED